LQISKAKDLEFSRKDVLEKMDRWQAALEEESWLEEYSRVRRLDRQTHHLYPLLHNPIRLLLVAEREQIQHRQRDAPRAQARGESPLPCLQNAGYVASLCSASAMARSLNPCRSNKELTCLCSCSNGGSSGGEGCCLGEGERRQVRVRRCTPLHHLYMAYGAITAALHCTSALHLSAINVHACAGGAAGPAGGLRQREEGEGAGTEAAAGPAAAGAGRGGGGPGRVVAGGPPAAQGHQERHEVSVHRAQRRRRRRRRWRWQPQEGGAGVVQARHAQLPQVALVGAPGRGRRGGADAVAGLLRVTSSACSCSQHSAR
jgi:hypothetical protein